MDIHEFLRLIAKEYYNSIYKSIKSPLDVSSSASLLGKAIEEKLIEYPSKPKDLELLLKKLKRKKKQTGYYFYLSWRKKMGLDKTEHFDLSRYLTSVYMNNFSRIVKDSRDKPVYNIIGAPKGTDIDIVVKVTSQKPVLPADIDEAKAYFTKNFGCSESELDLIFITETFSPSTGEKFFTTDKGGKETINIGFHTYGLHIQEFDPFFSEADLVLPQTHEQIFGIGKWIFDKMKKFLGSERYRVLSKDKKELYELFDARNAYGCKLVKEEFNQNENRRLWKSIVMKISQLHIYKLDKKAHHDKRTYIKEGMASIMGDFFPPYKDNFFHSLLYREHHDKTIPDGFKNWIIDLYMEISRQFFPTIQKENLIQVSIGDNNPTPLTDRILRLWLGSPKKVTEDFAVAWIDEYGISNLGYQFQEECKNIDILGKYFPMTNIDTTPPRSPEWTRRYNEVYITGRNTGVKEPPLGSNEIESIIHYSNLIGGNIGESIAFDYLEGIVREKFPLDDFKGIVTVGMISKNGAGSKAFCPDALAVFGSPLEIIPIEIKTFQIKPAVNGAFMRGFSLARQQILGSVKVLNKNSTYTVAKRGLGVFLFIDPDEHGLGKIHTHIYDFHQDEIVF